MENKIICGDCLQELKKLNDCSVDCCVTSPPYYALRDYGIDGQIGLEETPEEYIEKLVKVFREVKRVLKDDGTLWINIGDSYWGSGSRGWDFTDRVTDKSPIQINNKGTEDLSRVPKLIGKTGVYKNKDIIGIPWMLAFALRADGWYLRQDIIWHKPNPMPESVKDRCVKAHEYIFLLSKKPQYFFDYKAIQEDSVCKDDKRFGQGRLSYEGKRTESTDSHTQTSFVTINEKRNKRDVWSVNVKPIKDAHFATYPEELIQPCILAGCRSGGGSPRPFLWKRYDG